ncbi:MAG TPA: PP2C family protein-serine/threonine phosphatase [Solirubrobacteraceae bacterium]|nr:PP2C family protein-serine/threonine phosphatase [Solirubrobacteraceae bacterium]
MSARVHSTLLDVLPRGTQLPEAAFASRHRVIVGILWLHLPVLLVVALANDVAPLHAVLHPLPVLALTLMATSFRSRRARSTCAALGLLTCSAVLVHSLDGLIEAHFHFFAVLTVLAIYEDWTTYGLALGYVILHHGLAGTTMPYRVFDHPRAEEGLEAWRWAGVHGLFFAFAVAASLALWKLNERSRESALSELRSRTRAEAVAEALARGLRPDALPRIPGVQVAGRYEPGGGHVGGDWYDAITFDDGRLLVALGDVAGHGPDAAGLSARLRHILRAYAEDGFGPAALLDRLDRSVGDKPATVACLLLDPAERRVTYAIAGHLPPIVRHADGSVRWLDRARSVPLAGLEPRRHEVTEPLEDGATIVLFSDGLIERRDESVERGMGRLREAVARIGGEPAALAHRLVNELAPECTDDVSVLAVRLDPERVAVGGAAAALTTP